MDSFSSALDILLLAIVFGSGGYALYTYLRLRREWRIFNNAFLRPANCPASACKDPDGFLEYAHPRLLLVAIACIVSGVLYVPVAVPNFGKLLHIGATVTGILTVGAPLLGFAALVVYMIAQGKAAKRFWN